MLKIIVITCRLCQRHPLALLRNFKPRRKLMLTNYSRTATRTVTSPICSLEWLVMRLSEGTPIRANRKIPASLLRDLWAWSSRDTYGGVMEKAALVVKRLAVQTSASQASLFRLNWLARALWTETSRRATPTHSRSKRNLTTQWSFLAWCRLLETVSQASITQNWEQECLNFHLNSIAWVGLELHRCNSLPSTSLNRWPRCRWTVLGTGIKSSKRTPSSIAEYTAITISTITSSCKSMRISTRENTPGVSEPFRRQILIWNKLLKVMFLVLVISLVYKLLTQLVTTAQKGWEDLLSISIGTKSSSHRMLRKT